MIFIEKEKRDYMKCNACLSNNSIKIIQYWDNESQKSTMRLCRRCRQLLRTLLEEEEKLDSRSELENSR